MAAALKYLTWTPFLQVVCLAMAHENVTSTIFMHGFRGWNLLLPNGTVIPGKRGIGATDYTFENVPISHLSIPCKDLPPAT